MFLIKKLETKFTREEKKINGTKLKNLFSAYCKNPQRERVIRWQVIFLIFNFLLTRFSELFRQLITYTFLISYISSLVFSYNETWKIGNYKYKKHKLAKTKQNFKRKSETPNLSFGFNDKSKESSRNKMLAHRLRRFDLTEPIRRSLEPIEPAFATILCTMVWHAWTLSPHQRLWRHGSLWQNHIDCVQIRRIFFFNFF